jgi:hypothetical protein
LRGIPVGLGDEKGTSYNNHGNKAVASYRIPFIIPEYLFVEPFALNESDCYDDNHGEDAG